MIERSHKEIQIDTPIVSDIFPINILLVGRFELISLNCHFDLYGLQKVSAFWIAAVRLAQLALVWCFFICSPFISHVICGHIKIDCFRLRRKSYFNLWGLFADFIASLTHYCRSLSFTCTSSDSITFYHTPKKHVHLPPSSKRAIHCRDNFLQWTKSRPGLPSTLYPHPGGQNLKL